MWVPDRRDTKEDHQLKVEKCPKCGGTCRKYEWFKPAFEGQDVEDEEGREWVELTAEEFAANGVVDGVDGLITNCPKCQGNGVVEDGDWSDGIDAYDLKESLRVEQ